jgi:uncharacterized protein (TIGR03790 family)
LRDLVKHVLTTTAVIGVLLASAAQPAAASVNAGRSVLVVVNGSNADSVRIGEYYAQKRAVPDEQILRLTDLPSDPPDGIDRAVFDRAIQAPIARWLATHQAQDRILFIVLTKGVPLRINGGASGQSAASVDSELSVLYLRMTGATVPLDGPLPNPYFAGERPIGEAKPFTHEAQSIYLVSRLDGFTVADVLGLIDRGVAPSRTGRFVLDGKVAFSDKGNVWLRTAAERLKAAGVPPDRVVFDESFAVLTDQVDVLGYYSWGSNDPAIRQRHFGLKFQPGAIGGMFVSTDGRTFREPPQNWALAQWNDKTTWFAGSPQSLAGDLIRDGITGVAGHVAEPMLGHTIRPDILFPAYVAGFSLAEAFYLAMPSLSWMTVVVGDPLCAPFADQTTRKSDDPPIDPATELPAVFSQRRLDVLARGGDPRAALQLLLRAEGRMSRGDPPGARADLERATEIAPRLLLAQYALAAQYEAANEFDAAIARYRRILDVAPREVLALNNLAYGLAVRKGNLAEALPLAEMARKLAPRSGAVADTLGWIHFMAGDSSAALALLREAVREAPDAAEIQLHFAQALASSGDKEGAAAALTKALELAPAFADRPEVKAMRSR